MKKAAILAALLGFTVLATARIAIASPTVKFVMPQGVDPTTQLFFFFNGDTQSFTGDDLMPGNGVEFHSGLGSDLQFTKLTFSLNPNSIGFEGGFDLLITHDTNCSVELDWTGPESSGLPFSLSWREGAAKIGQLIDCTQITAVGPAFGSMVLTNTSGLPTNFGSVIFNVTANVPEPGAYAMAGGLLLGALPFARRIRRRK